MDIITACDDKALFRPWFKDVETWTAWRAFLRALFALPMSKEDLDIYTACTSRTKPPTGPAKECWLACGRRNGKSFITALVAVYLATFKDYSEYLSPGERGVAMVLACDKRQAKVVLNYIRALLVENKMLAKMVQRETAEGVDLTNGISVEVHSGNYRSVRGRTVVATLLDEVAFWRSDESANPDVEVLRALRPAMATVPDALLVGLSSPYARKGILYAAHKAHHGAEDDPVLVWQAPTRTMNPTVPQSVIDDAFRDDPVMAASEYNAEFRGDIQTFLPIELVEGLVRAHPLELPPAEGFRYHAFCDPSGGRQDSMTLGIAHQDNDRVAVDVLRSVRPPFDPKRVVADFAAVLRDYRLGSVTGDKYGANWVSGSFKEKNITYLPSRLNKSEIYLEALPQFSREAVELPPDRGLLTELASLERRTSRAGRDTVDHPPRGHDDAANAVCGALWLTQTQGAMVHGSLIGNRDLRKASILAPLGPLRW